MDPLITVIIPIYNAERFLRPSVDSVLAQTYRNLEIILVDDGSSDDSGAICDSYAEQDKRVRVIHKSNGGVSSARNVGLDTATGDYIAFVDSDDTIDPDMYDVLFKTIQQSGADMAVCGYEWHKGHKQRAVRVPQEGCFSVPQLYEKYLENFVAWASLMTSIWTRLISADLVRAGDQPIRFLVDLHRSEDAAFIADCLAVARNDIAFVDICPYHYDLSSNTASLTKTVDYYTLEIPLKKLRENMLAALPHRREEIENVFAAQLAMMSVWATINAIQGGQLPARAVTWQTVTTVLKYSKRADEKLVTLLLFVLPRPLIKLAARFAE
jgi:glycosyltransferase involved in cell wall biosynthesis